MKTITITQPWATLIVLEEKRFVTPGWDTKHRGELAIHAGEKVDKKACQMDPIRSVLAKYGYTSDELPTGSVVGITKILEVYPITNASEAHDMATSISNGEILEVFEGDEYEFGCYEEGCFAWKLAGVQRLIEPIPAKGQQGLWNWTGDHKDE